MIINGCWNTPRRAGYWVKEREYYDDGSFEIVDRYVNDVTSKDCHHESKLVNPELCDGCWK